MDGMKGAEAKRKYLICFFILWVAQMAAAFYFCTQKQGFHEDELYTYYSTARTNGFYVENGKWMERETYRNEFVVLPDERFQYGLVKQVQSWDVHPPVYYWVFHTVASLVPGVFSKWIGLSVNLFFHAVNLCLLAWLTYLVSKKDWMITLLVNLVYGFSPAAMSGVVFIRMYEMLTTFVLLCAILHVRAVWAGENGWARGAGFSGTESLFRSKRGKDNAPDCSKRLPAMSLLAMAAVTYLGFLTHYYYFIFLFFLAGAFCLWLLWKEKNIGNCLRYALAQGLAFGLAYLTYPAFPGQMFRGQRGAQATKNFFDLSNTFKRIWFFLDLINGYVFGYLFFVILLVAAALAVRAHWRRGRAAAAAKREAETAAEREMDAARRAEHTRFCTAFWLLLIAAAGYFIAVSKTALLLGNTSNRYQLPIYGIAVLLSFYSCKILWAQAVSVSDRHRKLAKKAAVAFCLAVLAGGYLFADVVFLYPEAKEERALAREQAAEGIPVVYVYQPGEEWCIWAVADVLMEYKRVYFVADGSEELITEPAIADADTLVGYLPDDDWKDDEQNMRIAASCHASLARRQHQYKFCEAWYFYDDEAADSGKIPDAGHLTHP